MYETLLTLHNATGGLTLIATLVTALVLFFTARTSNTWTALALRITLILASLQGVLGILMVLIGQVWEYWFHYALGLITVGVVSAVVARARRAPNTEARRYGGILLGVVVLVLVTFLVGQYRWTI
jgi:heme A synthase